MQAARKFLLTLICGFVAASLNSGASFATELDDLPSTPVPQIEVSPEPQVDLTAEPTPTPVPSRTSTPVKAISKLRVEQSLKRLGLPVGKVNGAWGDETKRAVCMWRELSNKSSSRNYPSAQEMQEIVDTVSFTPSNQMVVGLNVSLTCQGASWVVLNKEGTPVFREFFQVTTGAPGRETKTGTFKIYYQTNAWHESTLYKGAMMYRPKYFYQGQALHGSASDSMIGPKPASHGCVRMLHADIKKLWNAHFDLGSVVRVYGAWRG